MEHPEGLLPQPVLLRFAGLAATERGGNRIADDLPAERCALSHAAQPHTRAQNGRRRLSSDCANATIRISRLRRKATSCSPPTTPEPTASTPPNWRSFPAGTFIRGADRGRISRIHISLRPGPAPETGRAGHVYPQRHRRAAILQRQTGRRETHRRRRHRRHIQR